MTPSPRPWLVRVNDNFGGATVNVTALGQRTDRSVAALCRPADAELIVEAVNAYDRLARIEAAAREWLVADQAYIEADFGADEEEQAVAHVAKDALRAALAEPVR